MARVPEILSAPWMRGNERFHELLDLLELCAEGIARTPHVARYAEVENELLVEHKIREQGNNANLEHLQALASKATRELTLGLPTLHAHIVVSLWSIVENTVEDFVVEWIKYDSQFMSTTPVPKVKVSLSELMVLDEDERTRYILSEIKQYLGCNSAKGVEKFERLLNLCGFSSSVDDDIRKTLLELSEVRNVIVHRGGLADRRLLKSCPWLGLSINDKVAVEQARCNRYINAVDSYMGIAMRRVTKKFKGRGQDDALLEGDTAQLSG